MVSGTTTSTSGLASTGAWSTKAASGFIAKFSSTLKQKWCTYYGANASFIRFDRTGNIYLGGTGGTGNFASAGAWKKKAENNEAFLAKFSSAGKRIWGTYYGGKSDDYCKGMNLDNYGHIYFDSIATKGSYKDSTGSEDAFLVKLDTTGKPIWGTYYGGNSYDACHAMDLDAYGVIHLAGVTNAGKGGGIATATAFQKQNGGGKSPVYNAFLANFDSSGQLLYGTFYGGKDDDYCDGVTSDKYGSVYIGGGTTDTGLYITSGAYQKNNNGAADAFIVKFSCPPPQVVGKTLLCGASIASYYSPDHIGSVYNWKIAGGKITSGQNTDSVNVDWGISVKGMLKVIETSQCLDSAMKNITLSPVPKPAFGGDSVVCFNTAGTFVSAYDIDTIGHKWFWSSKSGKILYGQTMDSTYIRYTKPGKDTLRIIETNAAGCTDTAFHTITIRPIPNANWSANVDTLNRAVIFSPQDTLQSIYFWNFGDGTNSYLEKPSHQFRKADTFNISLRVYDDFSCTSEKDSTIIVSLFTGLQNSTGNGASLNIYPNPFKDKIVIQYTIVKDARVSISLEDIFGKQIVLLQNINEASGNYSLTIDAEKYTVPSGVYMLKIVMDGKMTSRKIVKM